MRRRARRSHGPSRALLLGISLALCAVTLVVADEAAPVVLCDFDVGEPTDGWTMRKLVVAEIETPHGRGLKLACPDATGGFLHRATGVRDWRRFRAFSMRARVDSTDAVEMRVQAIRSGGGRLLRRFTLAPGEWRDVVLPLEEFRNDGEDASGAFAEVDRVLLRWDKGQGDVSIDDLRLLPGDRGALSCTKTPEAWRRLAFGDAKARCTEGAHFVVLDDAAAMKDEDARRLVARLEEGLTVLADRYGVAGELDDKVPFCVFSSRPEYEDFARRLGEHFGATVAAPKADGFSIFGVGMSAYDPAKGWDRPVFVHEAMHGAIERLLRVGSNGNWIQEGLASAVQARLHPESLDRAKLADGFAKRGGPIAPWAQLFAKPRAALTDYAALASVVDFLAERHRDALPKAWDAVRAVRKPLHAEAMPAIAAAIGVDPAKLEEEWFAWGADFYRPR
jgi:hypothetical protein